MKASSVRLSSYLISGIFLLFLFVSCNTGSNSGGANEHASMGEMGGHAHGAGSQTIRLSFKSTPLKIGQRAEVIANLSALDGSPVLLSNLKEVHTMKIHFLIIDPSFTDYHHEHPVPTGNPGEYKFSFTPKMPGSYRVWADLHPLKTDRQEYVIADLKSEGAGKKFSSPKVSTKTVVDGMTYEITSEAKKVEKDKPVLFKLRITDSSGKIIDQLEPVMGAYAHIVGFSQDYKTIAHVHPMGAEPEKESDRGKGDLEFHLQPPVSGYLRLFAQTKLKGVDRFAMFTILVE